MLGAVMEFDELANYGPNWMATVRDLLLADEPVKAMEEARRAFAKAAKGKDAKSKVFALYALAKVHASLGELSDARQLAEKALAELEGAKDDELEAALLHTVAKLYRDLYMFQDALEISGEALAAYQKTNNRAGEAAVLNTTARIKLKRDQKHEAVKVAKQALALFRDIGEKEGEAEALQTMARSYSAARRHEDALRCANEMVGIYQGGPDVDRHCLALWVVANVRAAMEEHEEAVDAATKAVELLDGVDKRRQAAATRRLAQACFNKGDDTDGWMYVKEALELYREVGHAKGEATMLCELAMAHFVTGNVKEGALIADEAKQICQNVGLKQQLANMLEATARARLDVEATGATQEQQNNWRARVEAKEALALYEELGDLSGQMKATTALAVAFLSYGNVLEGRAQAKKAVRASQMMCDKAAEGTSLLLVAQSRFHDNREEALRLASVAQRLIKDVGDKKLLAESEQVIEAIREDGQKRKGKGPKKGVTTLAETQAAAAQKFDLTMDFDMMKTRAVYFYGFTSRSTR